VLLLCVVLNHALRLDDLKYLDYMYISLVESIERSHKCASVYSPGAKLMFLARSVKNT
jgi:hypothetical protein